MKNRKEYFKSRNNLRTEKRNSLKMSLAEKDNIYSKNQYKYIDKIISYDMSPTKQAYIGLAKQPLIPNENGIGYKGVKLQSTNRELIQCNECGKWFSSITHFHLRKHKLSINEYKEKYGYNKGTALMSDVASNKYSEIMIQKNSKDERFILSKYRRVKNLDKFRKGKKITKTIERENNTGTCPLQLKYKIANHINRFRMLPYKTGGRDGFQHLTLLKKRHNGLNGVYSFYGLPTKKRIGRMLYKYVFPDKTIHYCLNENGYNELYKLIKDKCEIMKIIND